MNDNEVRQVYLGTFGRMTKPQTVSELNMSLFMVFAIFMILYAVDTQFFLSWLFLLISAVAGVFLLFSWFAPEYVGIRALGFVSVITLIGLLFLLGLFSIVGGIILWVLTAFTDVEFSWLLAMAIGFIFLIILGAVSSRGHCSCP